MKEISRITNKNITIESIEKIYRLRFDTYIDKFSNDKIPSIDEHILFIYRELNNKKVNWFGIYNFSDSSKLPSLIGISCLYNHKVESSSIEFGRLMVEPSSTSNGFATELLKYCLNYAKIELLCKNVFLSVRKDNTRAIEIYEREGFILISTQKDLLYKKIL